jgi:hypothetical protein
MKNFEEEIQRQVEEGRAPSTDANTRAYQRVFDALSQEPEFELPAHFEDRVLKSIEANEKATERKETYWLITGIFVLIIASIIGAILVGFKPSFGAFGFLSRHTGLFIFAVVFILLLQWVDRKIVHRTIS